jgi:hypothetical protein
MAETDPEMDRLREGDKEAWKKAYEILFPLASSVVQEHLPNSTDTHDIALDTLAKISKPGFLDEIKTFDELKNLTGSMVGKRIDRSMKDELSEGPSALPNVLKDLHEDLKGLDASTHSVKEMTISDPSLTMKILRVANNVHYRGERGRVTGVDEAIATLGLGSGKMNNLSGIDSGDQSPVSSSRIYNENNTVLGSLFREVAGGLCIGCLVAWFSSALISLVVSRPECFFEGFFNYFNHLCLLLSGCIQLYINRGKTPSKKNYNKSALQFA